MDSSSAIETTPSTGTVVLLWADTFAAALTGVGQKGTRSPSTGAVVDTKALAQMLIAVPLAELHVAKVIRLEPFSKKSLGMFTSKGINAHALGEVRSSGQIEQRIAGSKKAREKGESVGDLVMASVRRTEHPEGEVIQWALDEAVELGYMHRESPGGIKGLVGGKSTVSSVMERIETTRERATSLAQTWKEFRDGNGELATELRQAIAKAFDVRRLREDNVDPNEG